MNNIGAGEALGLSLLGMLVVFFMLILLMVVIERLGKGAAKPAVAVSAAPVIAVMPVMPVTPAVLSPAKGSCGDIDLYEVDDRTAAMLMAIVAEQIGAPLCELRFKTIRKIK